MPSLLRGREFRLPVESVRRTSSPLSESHFLVALPLISFRNDPDGSYRTTDFQTQWRCPDCLPGTLGSTRGVIAMSLNFSLAGKTYEPVTEEVSADAIAAYASASRIDNPRHDVGPDQVPSVIFPVVTGLRLMAMATTDPELNVENPLMIVHGEQEIIHHRQMRPGETLVFKTSLESVEDKGKGATYVVRVSGETPDGESVNDQFATIFVRGAGSGEERASGEKSTPPSRGDQVVAFTKHIDEGMPGEYAVASGDRNPIHTDVDVAKAVGLPGVINHGLGTLSIVSGGLVDELAGGDPGRVSRIQVRFTDMVPLGSDLETAVFASDGDSLVFETARADGKVVMTGLVAVRSD